MASWQESLSYSRAYTYQKCRQSYKYKYLDRLKIAPKDMAFESWERMVRGQLIHSAMEGAFLGQPMEKFVEEQANEELAKQLSDQQKFALEEMKASGVAVATGCAEWMPIEDWEPVMHNGQPMVEAKLTHPLSSWSGGFLGYADLVAKHTPTGRLFVLDYKSRARFDSEGAELYMLQLVLYMYVLQQMGLDCNSFAILELKPTPPKRAPRITRHDSGSVDGVRVSVDGSFRFTPAFRSKDFVARVWQQFEKQAVNMSYFRAEHAYVNMSSFNCGNCEFAQICQGELNGHDLQHILSTNYRAPVGSLPVLMEGP